VEKEGRRWRIRIGVKDKGVKGGRDTERKTIPGTDLLDDFARHKLVIEVGPRKVAPHVRLQAQNFFFVLGKPF
jgi:hypothetical protein